MRKSQNAVSEKIYTPEESRFKEIYFPQKAKCDVAHYRSLHFDFTLGISDPRTAVRGPIADQQLPNAFPVN